MESENFIEKEKISISLSSELAEQIEDALFFYAKDCLEIKEIN